MPETDTNDEFPAIRALGEISIQTRLLMVVDMMNLTADTLEHSEPEKADDIRMQGRMLVDLASELEERCLGPKGHG